MDKENKKPEEQKRPKGNIWVALIVSAVLVLLIGSGYNLFTNSQYEQTTFSQFMDAREAGQLLEVEIHTDRVIYSTKEEAGRGLGQRRAFYTGLPYGNALQLALELDAEGVDVDNKIVEDNSWIMTALFYVLMFA